MLGECSIRRPFLARGPCLVELFVQPCEVVFTKHCLGLCFTRSTRVLRNDPEDIAMGDVDNGQCSLRHLRIVIEIAQPVVISWPAPV